MKKTKSKMIITERGTKKWIKNKQLHREDGPAVEYKDGTKMWFKNNKLHRLGGPAVEYTDGTKAFYLNGKEYTEKQFYKPKKLTLDEIIDILGYPIIIVKSH